MLDGKTHFWYVCHTALYMDVLNMSFISINYGKVGKEDKAGFRPGLPCDLGVPKVFSQSD